MITPLDILSLESWILVGSIILLARYYIKQKYSKFVKLQIPYDPPSILKYGNLKQSFGKEALVYDNNCKKKYGPIWGSFVGLHPAINIHDPDILRQIFIKEFSNFPDREKQLLKVSGKEFSNSLTSVQGKQWKRIRTTMTPTFSTSKLKQMLTIVEWCADNAVIVFNRKIEKNGGVFKAIESFSRLSLDIICSSAFSTKVYSQDDTVEEPEISKQAKSIFKQSFVSPLVILCLIFPPFEKVVEKLDLRAFGQGSFDYFKSLTGHIIEKRRKDPEKERRVDLMQLLLDSEIPDDDLKEEQEKGLTRTEIIGNSILSIVAGYENTGNTMMYLAYCLACAPEIQTKVQEEIDEMYRTHGKFDYEGVNSLKMLDMCTNETLRLYIPVIRNSRFAENEITINGLTIPAGMQINIPSYALAHDPDYWDEPFEFKPERMEDMSQIDPMYFLPFGAGPRNCIGMRFAVMEVKVSIAKLLHNFTFKPVDDTPKPPLELKFTLSVRPVTDFNLKVVPRKEKN